MKLCSLFDGSGGFPLAGALCGITPISASEVEPYPIAVTKARFPNMQHLGDVSKINGADLGSADVVTFGSPCQDMSVAGQRKGLKHEENGDDETTRSGLFYEAIRIIKEMRKATNGRYPAYAIWENVPGAFSSNKGEDFKAVLQEFCAVCDDTVSIPQPNGGKWLKAGEIMGNGYSVAWRTFDAQYWGVPQRRRRVYLVADFTGERAAKILFERESLRGYNSPCGTQGQGITGDVENGTKTSNTEGRISAGFLPRGSEKAQGIGYEVEFSPTLTLGQIPGVVTTPVYCLQGNCIDRADTAGCNGKGWCEDVSYTLNTVDRPAVCYDARDNGDGKAVPTITGDHNNRITDYTALICENIGKTNKNDILVRATQQGDAVTLVNLCPTITAAAGTSGNNQPVLCYEQSCYDKYEQSETDATLKALGGSYGGGNYGGGSENIIVESYGIGNGQADNTKLNKEVAGCLNCMHDQQAALISKPPEYIVRRLTPIECCRLQGFPDGWGDIPAIDDMTDEDMTFWQGVRDTYADINGKAKKQYSKQSLIKWYNKLHTDGAEYKMWGNGIALPNALYVMQGVAECLGERNEQMKF